MAGPGSRRIEDDSAEVSYTGTWMEERGNYSGGSIRRTTVERGERRCRVLRRRSAHELYLGTRYCDHGGDDLGAGGRGRLRSTVNLKRALEDVLIRVRLGGIPGAGAAHRVVSHTGSTGEDVYFDFLEIAMPSAELPEFERDAV